MLLWRYLVILLNSKKLKDFVKAFFFSSSSTVATYFSVIIQKKIGSI